MALSPLLSLLSASATSLFLPPILVRILLAALHRAFPKLPPRPQHAQRAHAFVICSYILYTVLSSYSGLPITFYHLLGVSHPPISFSGYDSWKETTLRPRWLSLVRRYHPDKLGGSDETQAYFRSSQLANEALKNDQLRSAYERFGPGFIDTLPATILSNRDILVKGGMSSVGWYVVAFAMFIVIPSFSSSKNNKLFWRLSTLVLLASNELCLLSSSQSITQFPLLLPPLLTYEAVTLLRQLWFGFILALTHLPILSSNPVQTSSEVMTSQLGPLMGAMAVRTDISGKTLDKILRETVDAKGEDRETTLDRLVEEMARI